MNIYRIFQTINNGYDTYDSAIVIANNADEAKSLHPNGRDVVTDNSNSGSWCELKDVKVELIGQTNPYKTTCIILASFNAG